MWTCTELMWNMSNMFEIATLWHFLIIYISLFLQATSLLGAHYLTFLLKQQLYIFWTLHLGVFHYEFFYYVANYVGLLWEDAWAIFSTWIKYAGFFWKLMEKYEIYILGASNWWTLNKGFSEANVNKNLSKRLNNVV